MSNTLLDKLRTLGSRRAQERESCMAEYKKILSRASCPALKDDEVLLQLASELAIPADQVEADVAAALRRHEQIAATRDASEQQKAAAAMRAERHRTALQRLRTVLSDKQNLEQLGELVVALLQEDRVEATAVFLRANRWKSLDATGHRWFKDSARSPSLTKEAIAREIDSLIGPDLRADVWAALVFRAEMEAERPAGAPAEPQPAPATIPVENIPAAAFTPTENAAVSGWTAANEAAANLAVFHSGAQALPLGV